MWIYNIGTNLISDIIFSILVFVFFYTIFLVTKRRKLLKFFGIEKSKKLTIFTSNLNVEKYGSFPPLICLKQKSYQLSLIGLDFTRDSRPVFTTDDRTMFTTHDRPVFTTVGQSLPRMKRERNRQNGADPYEHLQRNHLPDKSRRK